MTRALLVAATLGLLCGCINGPRATHCRALRALHCTAMDESEAYLEVGEAEDLQRVALDALDDQTAVGVFRQRHAGMCQRHPEGLAAAAIAQFDHPPLVRVVLTWPDDVRGGCEDAKTIIYAYHRAERDDERYSVDQLMYPTYVP